MHRNATGSCCWSTTKTSASPQLPRRKSWATATPPTLTHCRPRRQPPRAFIEATHHATNATAWMISGDDRVFLSHGAACDLRPRVRLSYPRIRPACASRSSRAYAHSQIVSAGGIPVTHVRQHLPEEISVDQLKVAACLRLLRLYLLDVREAWEFETAHIAGAKAHSDGRDPRARLQRAR